MATRRLLAGLGVGVAIMLFVMLPGGGAGAAGNGGASGLAVAGNQLWYQSVDGITGGSETGDAFGKAVASGDFDGDADDDLAIGVPSENVSGVTGSGAIQVLYSDSSGLTANDQLWHQGNLAEVSGLGNALGWSLSSGDFNGDGYDDIAASSFGEHDYGAVAVLYGSSAGLTANNQVWTQDTAGVPESGEQGRFGGDGFGWQLAGGDFDGDGVDDLAVGNDGESIDSGLGDIDLDGDSDGAVTVFYGTAQGLTTSRIQLWSQHSNGIEGSAEDDDRFGSSLAACDFNGDDAADLAIGVPLEDVNGAVNAGAVNVIFGSPDGLKAAGDQIWDQDATDIDDTAGSEDHFGSALAGGDFDDDGFCDLAVGIPLEDIPGKNNVGAVAVLLGSANGITSSDQLWTQDAQGFTGAAREGDRFGSTLASAYFDSSYGADLAIGIEGKDVAEQTDAGAVAILSGGSGGVATEGSHVWVQDDPGMLGASEAQDGFGYALATGYFDSDGQPDLAIGVPWEDVSGQENAGAVAVIYGGDPVASTPTRTPTPGISATPTPTRTPAVDDVLGDVDCNGLVNSIDSSLVLQYVSGMIATLSCLQNADVNDDGRVDSIDATLILQYVAGMIDELPGDD